jgi:hypothetical protein
MDYIPLLLAGLIGGVFLVCVLAEAALWLFNQKPPRGGPSDNKGQDSRREKE